jgi:hypothetical protein
MFLRNVSCTALYARLHNFHSPSRENLTLHTGTWCAEEKNKNTNFVYDLIHCSALLTENGWLVTHILDWNIRDYWSSNANRPSLPRIYTFENSSTYILTLGEAYSKQIRGVLFARLKSVTKYLNASFMRLSDTFPLPRETLKSYENLLHLYAEYWTYIRRCNW